MSSPPPAGAPALLPAPFLRGLEGDLRALCADAKRQNASVKESAERVILQLKEADTPAASAAAADEAAAALCAACTAPAPPSSQAAAATHARVVVRAVACIHKLLTHRAVLSPRLPTVIDALEQLGGAGVDDAVTLKVLQALLSLLTVRAYVVSLPQRQLARAFSLLFKLRTAPAGFSGAGQKLEAEDGVIEVTAQAAFRQVASDLFSAAAAALEPGMAGQPVAALPPVVQAAHALFGDMCAVIVGSEVSWLSLDDRRVSRVLALEVVDDGLAGNVVLFSKKESPLFSHLLSSRLCPGMHKMLRSEKEKHVLKALFGLVVTVLRSFWHDIVPDTEVLLTCLAKLVSGAASGSSAEIPWFAMYAMEALRAVLRDAPEAGREPIVIALFTAFDSNAADASSGGVMAYVLRAVCQSAAVCVASEHAALPDLPAAPLSPSFKPFSVSSTNAHNMYIAAATSVCLAFADAWRTAAAAGRIKFTTMMMEATAKGVAQQLACLLLDAPVAAASSSKGGAENTSALEQIIAGLESIAFATDKADVAVIRVFVTRSLASSASASLNRFMSSLPKSSSRADNSAPASATNKEATARSMVMTEEKRILALYRGLFALERTSGERFSSSWRDFVDAVQPLDTALHSETMSLADSDSSSNQASAAASSPLVSSGPVASALVPLKPALEAAFQHAASLSWTACYDLMSALVTSSRTSLASASTKRAMGSQAKTAAKISTSRSTGILEIRIFGIVRAESVMSAIFGVGLPEDSTVVPEAMPDGLWQLLTGHLIAIASDSPAPRIRVTALRSLVRVASCALESRLVHLVSQDKVLGPLTDLLSSNFVDTREGCLDAVYTLLETRGEFLKGSGAWSSIFTVLRSASGAAAVENSSMPPNSDSGHDRDKGGAGNNSSPVTDKEIDSDHPGEAMVQLGFRAVQLIADDFLSFLAFETLSQWVVLLRMYCQQGEDVNVALTAVGLIWRTADHFAKDCGEGREYDTLWMDLFEVLRAIGRDKRPEVRNGAVKTLTSTLTAHGTVLTAAAWRGCVERALLPLLEEVMHGGVSMLRESQPLGARGKSDAQLVLHHSRDTPRKQWNETRVLALGGVATVLRKAMPKLASLRDERGEPLLLLLTGGQSDALWAKMLRAAGSAASSTEKEVALAGVSALLELLHAAGSVVSDGGIAVVTLWETVWIAIDESVYGSSGVSVPVSNGKALVALTDGMGRARAELKSCFTPKSSILFIRILARLACGGTSLGVGPENPESLQPSRPTASFTEIQEAAMTVIELLSFGEDMDTWVALVSHLLTIVRGREGAGDDLLLTRVVRLIESLYTNGGLPAAVKANVLDDVISTLGVVMHEQHLLTSRISPLQPRAASPIESLHSQNGSPGVSPPPIISAIEATGTDESPTAPKESDDELWVITANAFISILLVGLKAGSPKLELWSTLHRVASEFLYCRERTELDIVVVESRVLEKLALVEVYDIKLAQAVRDALGLMSGSINSEMQRKLVDLLGRGAQEGMQGGRPRFVRACQSCMFTLADKQWNSGIGDGGDIMALRKDIAEQAAACVVLVSDSVLSRFVADGQRAGKCPLPAERRAEAVFLLKRLQALRLDDDGDGARRHLRTLHPRLCECVDKGGDDAVRLLAAAAIQTAA